MAISVAPQRQPNAGVPVTNGELVSHLTMLANLPALVSDLRREVEELRAQIERGRTTDPDGLLNVQDAARMLGLTSAALRQAVYRGTIPVVRVGRRLRFRRDDLLPKAC